MSAKKEINLFINFLNGYQNEKDKLVKECGSRNYSIERRVLIREIRSLEYVKKNFFKIFNLGNVSYNEDKIINSVCQFYKVNLENVLIKHPKKKEGKAKKIIIYLIVQHTNLSDKDLSKRFGLDRSSITFARNTISKMLINNLELASDIEKILILAA